MKKWLFKLLFPTYYNQMNDYELKLDSYNDTVFSQNNKIKKLENYILDIQESIKQAVDDKNIILGIEQNKRGEWVVIALHRDRNLWFTILLYGANYRACNSHPKILSTYVRETDAKKKRIKIEDIIGGPVDIGNGSIMMKYFINESKKTDAEIITGWLSDVDKGHWDRSTHFYRKFGFAIYFNERQTSGHIELSLN